MKFKIFLLTGVLLITLSFQGYSQRLVGYLQSTTYGATPGPGNALTFSQIQFDKLTDVIFCFLNPNSSLTGALQIDRVGSSDFDFEMDKFQIAKSKCYPVIANGPRLWVAIGGASSPFPGARPARLNTVCSAAGTRTTFATNLVNFAILHELEGIDIDWEFPTSAAEVANFSAFIIELRNRINLSTNTKLKISVAVGGETSGGCPAVGTGTNHMGYFPSSPGNATMLNAVDYFHIMAYDLPSTYNANHSTAADGNTSMTNWNSCRGIPLTKMSLGIPFYGKSDPRGTITNYFSLPAGAWTTDGPTSSVYYNGQPAISAKINNIRSTTYNGSGVVIWDIAQDKSGAESLLSYANTKMFGNTNNTNPCSTIPFLGKDTTICTGQTITLNSGVTTTGGTPSRTFSWIKNGAAFGGTSNTQAITTAGTYSVVVTQQYNPAGTNAPCTLKDTIEVSEQPDITAGPTSSQPYVCSTGSPTSTNLSATSTGTVQWYAASTGGAAIATGSPVSVSPTATTTYYAQAAAVPSNKKYYGGRGFMDNSTALWNERTANVTMTTRPEWVQRLTVIQPITIKSVVVNFAWSATHNPVSIMIMDAAGTGTNLATVPTQVSANQTAGVSIAAHTNTEPWTGYPTIVTVNITLQPGTYNVGVYNPNGSVSPQYAVLQSGLSFATSVANVFSIGANAYQNNGTSYGVSTHYGQIFDWRIESAALSQCSRKSVIVTHDCVAPVELTSFTGYNAGNQNNLAWSTASEINNNYFNIERSGDGINFEVIGSVNGNGTTHERLTYSLIDQNPLKGINYYRLGQYDIDGTVNYSSIIIIDNDLRAEYHVSPNPFENEIEVKSIGVTNKDKTLYITNIQGALVHEEAITSESQRIKLDKELSSGVYFLKIQDGNTTYNQKIIKR